jgi:hypothetical protein
MTTAPGRFSLGGVVTTQLSGEDSARTQSLTDARLAAAVAHSVASPALTAALNYLELLIDNVQLPDELRARAREAALRVAEAAVHLECLPEAFELP